MNKSDMIKEIKEEIQRQREIYNGENSTLKQQELAYKKKKELIKELMQLQAEV